MCRFWLTKRESRQDFQSDFADIGDEQSIGRARRLSPSHDNIVYFGAVNGESLVLLDELGIRGLTHAGGAALAIAILEDLRLRQTEAAL